MTITPTLFLSAVATLGLSLAASGQVVNLDFEGLTPGGINGQGGWTVNPQEERTANVVAGGLSYDNGAYSFSGGSQKLELDMSDGIEELSLVDVDFAIANFAPQSGGADNTIYFRFVMESTTSSWSFVHVGFSGGTSGVSSAAGIALRTPEQWRAWTSGVTQVNTNAPDLAANQPHLILGRVVFNAGGNESISFVANPTETDESLISWTTLSQDLGVMSFDSFRVRPNNNGLNQILRIDNVAVGDTFAAVIPEPSTYAMIFGALALCGAVIHRLKRS